MIQKVWEDRGEFNKEKVLGLSNKYKISPEIIAILDKRGVNIDSFFSETFSFPDALLLKDIEVGVDIVSDYIRNNKKICVVNDYDVDGATSGTIMNEAVIVCGGTSRIITPKRLVDGYGISKRVVDEAAEWGAELIITTDNGISAFEAIEYARAKNIAVVVTDHHELVKDDDGKDVLPKANAIIDAKRADSDYLFCEICGAEVALKFACVLFSRFNIDESIKKKSFRRFTELAAVGTICDVMPLVEENRTLVKNGLRQLKLSQIIGFRQLMKVQQINPDNISATDVGFRIGPCMNAMSRLRDDTDIVLDFLSEKDHIKALNLAEVLSKTNEERKGICEKAKTDALEIIEPSDNVNILYIPSSLPSIMGIVAGKIKDEIGKPTVCLTDDKDGILKGSGRSTDDYDMFESFSKYRDLFTTFGGHPKAVGLSIDKSNLNEFKQKVNDNTKGVVFYKKTLIDLHLPMVSVGERFIDDLERLEPLGEGNPAPVLCDDTLFLEGVSRMGKDGQFIRLSLRAENGELVEAVYFGDAGGFDNYISEYFGIPTKEALYERTSAARVPMSFVYLPKYNFWNGEKSISYVIKDYKVKE